MLLRHLHHTMSVDHVSDVYAEEHFHLLHCGPMDVDRGGLPLLSEEHNRLVCFVDVEGEVIFLAPVRQGAHLPVNW